MTSYIDDPEPVIQDVPSPDRLQSFKAPSSNRFLFYFNVAFALANVALMGGYVGDFSGETLPSAGFTSLPANCCACVGDSEMPDMTPRALVPPTSAGHASSSTDSSKSTSQPAAPSYSEWYGMVTNRKPYAPSKYKCPAWPTQRGPHLLKWSCGSNLCGGWGDRTRGMIGGFLLALVTNRSFGIDVKFPSPLQASYEPNMEDWSSFDGRVRGTPKGRLDRHWTVRETAQFLQIKGHINLQGNILMWKQIHQYMAEDTKPSEIVPGAAYSADELGFTDLKWPLGCSYRHLFKRLVEPIRHELEDVFRNIMGDVERPIISLHIRTIRTKNEDLVKYGECAARLENELFGGRKAYWFVSTDKKEMRDRVEQEFEPTWPGRVVHLVNGTVAHIDKGNHEFKNSTIDSPAYKQAAEKYMHMEWWTLIHSDALVVGHSGFAWGAGSVHLQKRTYQFKDCGEGERWF